MAGMIQFREEDGEETDTVTEDGAGDSSYLSCFAKLEPRFAKLERYAFADIYERNLVGKVILETLRDVAGNPHEVSQFFSVLYKMSDHPESAIRSELMDHVPHIAMLCHSNKGTLLYAVDTLLALVAKLLTDVDNKVRKSAQVTLLVLMDQALLQQSAVEDVICPVVIQQPNLEDYPGSGVQFMSKLAPLLGPEATERLFLKRFCELCQDPVSSVRKRCALNFGEFCTVVGQHTTEQVLLPRFVDLCRDEAWPVRKACADVLPSVSCICSIECRKSTLAPVFVNLLWDATRPVRIAAFRTLGPFISTFAVPSVADLTYNENGELVFTHPKGTEFRFHSSQERPLERFFEKQVNNLPMSLSLKVVTNHQGDDNYNEDLISSDKSQDLELPSVKDADNCYQFISHSLPERESENLGTDLGTSDTGTAPQNQSSDQVYVLNLDEIISENDNDTVPRIQVSEEVDLDDIFNESFENDENGDIASHEDQETQETDLDDDVVPVDSHVETDGVQPNEVVASKVDSSEECDFNSFQYWRIPIPDVDSKTIEEDFKKINLGNLQGKLTTKVQLTDNVISNLQSGQHLPHFLIGEPYCDKQNMKVFPMPLCSSVLACAPPQDIVPQELVEHFVSMTGPAHYNSEIAQHCAFSLPAVALTLGRKNWGFLRSTYEALANDMQWTVRRAVASSIHALAEILGEELATQDLVPIYSGFIKDLDEVRIGALRHLAEFLKLLPSAERDTFLPKLGEFLVTDNESNWRFREELAQQLFGVLTLFSAEDACTYIKPIAISLLRDKVAAVRSASLLLVTELIQHVKSESTLLRQLLPQLAEEFAHSLKWERRQAFALLCSHVVSGRVLPGEQFAREVMPHLLDLSYDPVPNVRLAVARTLASDMMGHHFFSGEPHLDVLMQVLRRLNNDVDRDVRYFAAPRFL